MAAPHMGPWYGRDRDRILFEGAARRYPGLRATTVARRGRIYRVKIAVPYYEPRQVEIRFEKTNTRLPRIYADGARSPHRYQDGGLCIWHPSDAPENRWVFEDGLLELLGHIGAHLFREAWWLETGEWPGPEAPHPPVRKEHTLSEDGHV
jgi:hypothetical protein